MSQKTNFYQLKKLTLVVIPTMENAYHDLQDFVAIMPPIGIASIAATAEKAGYEVSIIDGDAERITLEQTIERVVEKNPDYVGSTIMTATMDISKRFYEGLKDKMPQVTVIVGGPHVSAIPERTLEEAEAIDICVIGEGDQIVPEILNAIGNDNGLEDIPGIAYRKNNKIIITKKRPALNNLSTLPLPAFHLFNPELYRSYGWNKWVGGYRKPIGVIFTGRGCLGKCNFCAVHATFGQGIRYFTFQQIKDQIDYLIDKWKIRVLYFQDDTFTANRNMVHKICDYIIEKGYNRKLEIMVSARVDTVDILTLKKMREASIRWICFGVESGNQEILTKCINISLLSR